MPNTFAYLMLAIWPLAAVGLFHVLPLARALVASILVPYLLLPPGTEFDLPLVPALDKTSIPNVAAYLIATTMLGHRVPLLPAAGIGRGLMLLLVLSPVATVLTNGDPIRFETGGLPALTAKDTISVVIGQIVTVLPFFLGQALLRTAAAQREILLALAVAGLAYSLPMLVEIRLSPQLNVWIYGFFQHDFAQMMRQGGYRPIVFLYHGLWVAFFALMALTAAVALWRRERDGPRWAAAAGYLAVLLLLCKSLGVLVYALVLLPLTRLAGTRLQIRIAAGLALVALLFPLLRGAGLVPVDAMLAQAAAFSAERAQSLGYRFETEATLLAHASERPWFGWGPWGRNMVYDLVTGDPVTAVDGRWIIIIGMFGWFGYAVEFGLLTLPLLVLALRAGVDAGQRPLAPYAGALALLLATNLVDMLPNATLIPFTWLVAGALLGYADTLRSGAEAPAATALPEAPPSPRTIL